MPIVHLLLATFFLFITSSVGVAQYEKLQLKSDTTDYAPFFTNKSIEECQPLVPNPPSAPVSEKTDEPPSLGKRKPNRELILAGFLIAAIVITPLIHKISTQQKLTQVKKRFSENLQEEIQTNLHTIGLLSDLAAEPHNKTEEKTQYMKRIRMVNDHTDKAMRHLIELNDSKTDFGNLKIEIERTVERILSRTSYELIVQGETYLNKLPSLPQIGLFLFLKEYLISTVKHSSPSRINIDIVANAKETQLTISEQGLLDISAAEISHSLQHRARLINAKVTHQKENESSSSLILNIPSNKWGIF